MTISSVPVDYSLTSSDTITVSPFTTDQISALGNITISNSTGSSYYYTGAGIGGLSGSTITVGSGISSSTINTSSFSFNTPEEFIDCMPDVHRIQKMCEEYPGLKIAFEKFKTTYKLVKDHYDTPEDQRPRP